MAYEGLSTTYPLRPKGHKLEAIGIVLGYLLNSGHAIATLDQRNALEEIVRRGQRFRDVARLNILRRERVAVDQGLANNGGGDFEYLPFKGQDHERRSVRFLLVDAAEQQGRAMPLWAFISWFLGVSN